MAALIQRAEQFLCEWEAWLADRDEIIDIPNFTAAMPLVRDLLALLTARETAPIPPPPEFVDSDDRPLLFAWPELQNLVKRR